MFNVIGLLSRQPYNLAHCASILTKKRSAIQLPFSLNLKTNFYAIMSSKKTKSIITGKNNAKSAKKGKIDSGKKLDPTPKKPRAAKSKMEIKIEDDSDSDFKVRDNKTTSIKPINSSKKRKRSDSDSGSESPPPKKQKTTKGAKNKSTATDATPTPIFFDTPADLRVWFEENAATAEELILGMRKRASGQPSVNWYQAVGEALCFGWIDGKANGIDEFTYRQRFTPRRPGSIWSAVNITRVETLIAEGKMTPAGLAAFEKRTEARSKIYSHEQEGPVTFTPELEAKFRKEKAAWEFFEKQPPGYKRRTTWHVISAKKEETQLRRLDKLIEASAQKKRLDPFS